MAQKKKSSGNADGTSPIIIKKYANRRLYNTLTSSYVTLDHLSQMVKGGIEFVVHDAKSGEDITRSVLTQIIVEEEAKGQNLLPISFLRQLISFYGDSLQGLVPQYLEMTMQSFAHNQEQIRSYMNEAFGGMYPFKPVEEMSRQNLAIFEQAVNMFSPFTHKDEGGEAPPEVPAGADAEPAAETGSLDEMKAQLKAMQRQLDALSRTKDD